MTLGKIIRDKRKKLGMSQTVLAKKCGITQTTLSLIENDVNSPAIRTYVQLQKHLRLHPVVVQILLAEDMVPEKNKKLADVFFPIVRECILKIFDLD